MSALLRARALSAEYRTARSAHLAVIEVDLDINEGESFGLVGESGSGKSTVAMALTGFVPKGGRIRAEQLEVDGHDMLSLRGAALRNFRRHVIGVVHQDPSRSLNPTATVGAQLAECHGLRGGTARETRQRTMSAMEEVGLADPHILASRYPHELSGGQQQRMMIAMALSTRPRLLILDEPTTSLDSVIRSDVLALIGRLQVELGFASLLISHDLRQVMRHCSRIGVLHRGRLIESSDPARLMVDPQHPHTRALVAGYRTAGRAPRPISSGARPVLVASRLTKRYGSQLALTDVDLSVGRGETIGIVGESGSGKTTLARIIAGVTSHDGTVVWSASASPYPVQMVFQSPDASLNPRRTVRQALRRAIDLLRGDRTPEQLIDLTGLSSDTLDKLPSQLSGGQKQRVAIARAFAGRSPLVICDEPTSGLDASLQSAIVDLLIDLQERTGASYLFISHDLSVVRRIAHRVAVMQHGRIVESGSTASIFEHGRHPYTRKLISASQLDEPPRPYSATATLPGATTNCDL